MRSRESTARHARIVLVSRRRQGFRHPLAAIVAAALIAIAVLAGYALAQMPEIFTYIKSTGMAWVVFETLFVTVLMATLWLMWRSTDQRLAFDDRGIHFSTRLPAFLKWVQPDWEMSWSELRGVRHGHRHPQAPEYPLSVVFAGAERDRSVALMLPWHVEGDAPRERKIFYRNISGFLEESIADNALLDALNRFNIALDKGIATTGRNETR